MDISKTIAELKKRPDFNDNVGMILIHNGVVRNWSRQDHASVSGLETKVDHELIENCARNISKNQEFTKSSLKQIPVVTNPVTTCCLSLWPGTCVTILSRFCQSSLTGSRQRQ